jgi:hypothetical protein
MRRGCSGFWAPMCRRFQPASREPMVATRATEGLQRQHPGEEMLNNSATA